MTDSDLMNTWLADDPELAALVGPFLTTTNAPKTVLPAGDRELIGLIALTVQGSLTHFQANVNQALQAGVTPARLLETIYQLTPVIGYPKVAGALTAIHAELAADKLAPDFKPLLSDEQHGVKVQANLYGTEIKNLLAALPAGAGTALPQWLTQHFFNDYYRRSTLTTAQRERYELMALITLNVDFQIKAHARGSLKAGNSAATLVWAAIQLLPYIGFPLIINSVRQIQAAAEALND
ncbi:carboxymuconolactone decarboxylase family protein [Lactiplantibacillus fabifermentans]|nr:carboxymuconolactone decarboxylase family protein [Lactiplantibacillus fabifermentans]ETY74090.1 hypothetical protein LFAB_08870 [Lactiplantibacillus fabifermentans T30PCM01]